LIVLDASVVVHALTNTAYSEQARYHFKTNASIFAPEIILGEVANTLTRMVRTQFINREQAWAGFQLLQRQSIQLLPSRDVLDRAFSLSLEFNHAVFDCIYVAVAEIKQSRLITTDQRLIDKFSSPKFRFPPCHLRQWTA